MSYLPLGFQCLLCLLSSLVLPPPNYLPRVPPVCRVCRLDRVTRRRGPGHRAAVDWKTQLRF
eukprot:195909-Hanusia_phi.AAC.1